MAARIVVWQFGSTTITMFTERSLPTWPYLALRCFYLIVDFLSSREYAQPGYLLQFPRSLIATIFGVSCCSISWGFIRALTPPSLSRKPSLSRNSCRFRSRTINATKISLKSGPNHSLKDHHDTDECQNTGMPGRIILKQAMNQGPGK